MIDLTIPQNLETRTETRAIRCIALFKLFKAALLLVVIAASFDLIRHEPAQVIRRWLLLFHADPDNYYVHALLAWVLRIDVKHLTLFALGSGLYALLFAVEGIGLWFAKTWAEYLTILSTAGLLPIEGYEFVRHFSLIKGILLACNAAIVAYLVEQVRTKPAPRP